MVTPLFRAIPYWGKGWGCMLTPHWVGELGFDYPHWAGEVVFMVTPQWARECMLTS